MGRVCIALLVSSIGAAACTSSVEHGEKTGALSQGIVGGWEAADDPHVVALVSPEGVVCSGTLIAERVVLTAAHCALLTPTSVSFEGGSLPARVDIPIATFNIHPEFDAKTLDNDIAIITLLERAPAAVAVSPLSRKAITPEFMGSGLRVVGFGRASVSDAAVRQQGWVTISEINPTRLRTVPGPSQPCRGDSGGPAFSWIDGRQYLVGVISSGDAACNDHANIVRTDAFLASFVTPMLAAVADGAGRVGQRCFHPDNCASPATCYAGGSTSAYAYCTRSCEDSTACLPGMTCAPQKDGGSLCLFPRPPGVPGSTCIADTDCNSLHCARRGDAAMCADTCIPHVIPCSGDQECLADAAHPDHYACFPPTVVAHQPVSAAPASATVATTPPMLDPPRSPPEAAGGCAIAPPGPRRPTTAPWLVLALAALTIAAGRVRRARR